MRQPKWQHDCPRCVFLGHIWDNEEGDLDLYFCPQIGNNGGDYESGMPKRIDLIRHPNSPLSIAACEAIDRGLMTSPRV